jgi:hypothetical protein
MVLTFVLTWLAVSTQSRSEILCIQFGWLAENFAHFLLSHGLHSVFCQIPTPTTPTSSSFVVSLF